LNFYKKTVLLIAGSTLLRMAIAGFLELGNDEVYYQAYARHLQWSYFDHPPMVAWMIRITTFNLHVDSELFIRLGSVLFAAAGTWLIFKIGTLVKNEYTGFISAILYTNSFYTSVISGIFVLPDSPQVFFWLLGIYCMIRVLNSESPLRKQLLYWLLLGISLGLCIMSKVHGIFLWLGFGAYIVFHRKDLLKSPGFWISGLITLFFISPIFFWNFSNHFITYTYHRGRIGFLGGRPDPDRLMQQVLGSVFYSNPVNFIIYVLAVWAVWKQRIKSPLKIFPLFLWLSLPLIIVLIVTSLFNETLPHWSGPAYLSIMILSACWLEECIPTQTVKWLKASGLTFVLVVFVGVLGIRFLPFRIGSSQMSHLGKGDITLDLCGWRKFGTELDSLFQSDAAAGIEKPGAVIVSDYWFPAGHLDHYSGVPFHHNLIAFGNLHDIHHFAWLNQIRPRIAKGSDAYFIYPSNEYGPPHPELKNKFELIDDSIHIPQIRNGIVVRYFVIYRMHHFLGDSSDYLIPRIK
jgi:hypothetical protein